MRVLCSFISAGSRLAAHEQHESAATCSWIQPLRRTRTHRTQTRHPASRASSPSCRSTSRGRPGIHIGARARLQHAPKRIGLGVTVPDEVNLLQPLARVHKNRGELDGQYSFQRLALGALTAATAKAGNVRQRATGRQARRVPAEAEWKSLAVAVAVMVATMVAVVRW